MIVVVLVAVAVRSVERGDPVHIELKAAIVLAGVLTLILYRWDRPYPPPCCWSCGYNLTGNVSGICPECGTRIPEPASDDAGGDDEPADACPMCLRSLVHEPDEPVTLLGRPGEVFCIFCKRWVPRNEPPADSR